MGDYAGHSKLCATCVYWIAKRDTDTFNSCVKNCSDVGRCGNPYGVLRNAQRYANNGACNEYQKWPVLK